MKDSVQESKFYLKIHKILKGFVEGLKTISQLDRPWLFLFHSTNVWVMYYLMNYLCFFSFAPTAHLSPGVGLMVFVFVLLVSSSLRPAEWVPTTGWPFKHWLYME